VVEIIRGLNAIGIVFCVLPVAIAAQAAGGGRQHRVAGFDNIVIAVAFAAFRPVVLIESLFVFAAIEQAGVRGVADTATLAHLGDPGRAGGVIAMTRIAARRAEIAAGQRFAVNAFAIFRQLRCRERRTIGARDTGHHGGVRVTSAAGLGHPLRVNFRLRILRLPNSVNSMAADTRRGAIIVKIEKSMAVRAGLEFRELVCWQRRIKVVHFRRIGVAARAELDDPRPILVPIFLGPLFDLVVTQIGGGIAAVASGAGKALTKMNIFHQFLQIHV
jgi:hypothetical protein